MKYLALMALIFLGLNASAMSDKAPKSHDHQEETVDENAKTFGGHITTRTHVTLADAMNRHEQLKGEPIAITGQVEKVCQSSGCWMVIKDGDKQVRTMFKDYGFTVPKNILGKKVRLQGIMDKKEVSASTIRHLMKDEGKSKEEIDKVKAPQMQFEFTADAVEII
ncbi:MAG: DUF4920 domain-containing protein [Bdellovibrionales bacterium]|nr:DUF4920 domain-containing protein [Bdellovibrionales bacterium]